MIFWLNMNMLAIACTFYFEPFWAKMIFLVLDVVCLWFALSELDELIERVSNLEIAVSKLIREVHPDGH